MIAIEVENLGRTFDDAIDLSAPSPRTASAILAKLFGLDRFAPQPPDRVQTTPHGETQALSGVDLTVDQGACVCLTGPSGAGKSVLLRILSGATPPTSGRAVLRGAVTRLLSPGDNLNPSRSVLANIHHEAEGLRGESRDRFADDVLAFAGIERFRAAEVSRLSTGMQLRLSLALALKSNAEILLIDDVFGVGDISFQRQCADALARFKRRGGTILMATGNSDLVDRLADRIVLMRAGRIVEDAAQTHAFSERHSDGLAYRWENGRAPPENDVLAIQAVFARLRDGTEDPELELSISVLPKAAPVLIRPSVYVAVGKTVLFRTLFPRHERFDAGEPAHFTARLPLRLLPPDAYRIGVSASTTFRGVVYSLKFDDALDLEVAETDSAPPARVSGMLAAPLEWEIADGGRT